MKHLPNLLVVDDTPGNMTFLEVIIKNIDVNLIMAYSGSEALEKTRGLELALAIIDVRMPGMNGYDLALKMNEDRLFDKVPVIFLTASNSNEMEVFKGYSFGAVDYLFKPIHKHILVSKINVFLDLFNQKQTVIRDATLLKKSADNLTRVNDALKKSEEKYTELYDFAPLGYFTLTKEQTIQDLNYSGAGILGNERSHLINRHFSFFVSDSTRPVFNAFFNDVFRRKTKQICEVILQPDGNQPKYVHIEGMAVANGKQCLINVVDITKRKLAEQAIKVSEEKYKTLLNASPDGILLIDLQGIITEVSEIGLELFGANTRDDLVDKDFYRFVPSDEINKIKDIFEKTMNEGLAQNIGLKMRKKNQSVFDAETSSTLIQGPDGTPISFMIIIRDISQRKKVEAKQLHADRMANLGEMASGIAHEINQPLNIISMVMDKILFETAKTETINIEFLKNKSDKIFDNITRIRNIIDHVRAFSRGHDDFVLTAFYINSSIENATSMIMEQFKYLGINLNLQLDKNIPQIVGNTYKFEQVIVNLLTNAKDAVIEKKIKQEEFGEMIVEIKTYQENQFLIIEITDNGIGIDNDDVHNIMLPFYTTKDEGKGTGLGLSICYQIIKEMNGTIDITSDKVNGTKSKLVLDIQKKK
ncbi:MAG: PAS domain S-box protein [Bacteroidota bacterium]|nr:PAS domain S-box protein [Bacteroidota bacterium]